MSIDWKGWRRALIDLIFPGECPICKKHAYENGENYSCISCLDLLSWVNRAHCRRCGVGMEGMIYEGLTCRNCREYKPSFQVGRTMFHLDAMSRELVHEIKYNGVKQVLDDMPLFVEHVPGFDEFITDAVLIPVPLHTKKYNHRGFNQSKWIAQAWANLAGPTTVVYDCLKRVRHTNSQTKLDRSQRLKNVKNAFALKDGTCLDGFDRLVLVDDVFTTGATLDACAKVLIERGFSKVEVATLGHG